MVETALDRAHGAMETAPEDDAARLAFYQTIANAELFLLLESEPVGVEVAPKLFELESGRFVMAFDLEERLAEFCDKPVPYAALPGRVIAGALAGQDIGIGLNLGVAPSAFQMVPAALAWLVGTLAQGPHVTQARPLAFSPPDGVPITLLKALELRLAQLAGLARAAYLVQAHYEGGRKGHMLAFEGARDETQDALAKAVSETLVFSGIDAAELDVTFLGASHPVPADLLRVAHRIEMPTGNGLPEPVHTPSAPGMDPNRPPRLK
ncbi:MAG: SseB family protein [Albidovulum sp.]